jgi:hypothetical protein
MLLVGSGRGLFEALVAPPRVDAATMGSDESMSLLIYRPSEIQHQNTALKIVAAQK